MKLPFIGINRAQEGTLNSSSNNSKFKDIDNLKAKIAAKNNAGGFGGGAGGGFGSAGGFGGSGGGFGGGFGTKVPKRQQQIIIEEEEEEKQPGKLFDFDLNQTDASLRPPKDIIKPIMVGVIAVVSLVFGAFIGWCWQGVLSDRADVNNRIVVAQKVDEVVSPKIDAFQTFVQKFKQRSESMGAGVLEYDEKFFNETIVPYASANFVLDISKDLPADTIVMASNSAQNPLSDIRGYAAGTTLLSELLDSHIEQTNNDLEEIKALLGDRKATDRNIIYAIKVNPKQMLDLVTPQSLVEKGYNRLAEAVTSSERYTVVSALTDDEVASKVFMKMIEGNKIPADEVESRTYKPEAEAKAKAKKTAAAAAPGSEPVEVTTDNSLTLPSRLIYEIADQNGKTEYVFADQIILIERNKLFSDSANGLERYKKRMIQILAILGEVEKTTDGLGNRLHIISTEEPL